MANEAELRTYLKKATLNLQKTRQRLRELESRVSEPIAIIGMACRYPGGIASPDDLWTAISEGRDLISGWPTDRGWDVEALYEPDEPGKNGKSYVRVGGFVHDAGEFDAAFFGISPREALAMDPQQRVVLESAWEAIEHAGLDPAALAESDTGVFLGIISADYGPTMNGDANHKDADAVPFLVTGLTPSVASGRVAYALGLQGPAVSIDTACSSSFAAIHQAVQSLRLGECSLALAGGVTVATTAEIFVGFSAQKALAPDGRCKSFAAAADGTGFSEGVGMLMLERLSQARRNGHRVLGLIRGTAVNQDGASNGLAAPNGLSQQRVIRQALANADLSAADIDVIEAHGTATVLGDPIEAQALLATYGQHRPDERPVWMGTIKSNMGHTQAAAGVAGLIKMVEAMRHEVAPPTLHVDEPTPHVDWSVGNVRLLTEAQPWPRGERPRRAAISSFGISGTNSHVIVEEAPPDPDAVGAEPVGPAVVPWVLSAKSERALTGQAAKLLAYLERNPDVDPVNVGYSLVSTRVAFDHRAVVVGRSRADLTAGLALLAGEDVSPTVVRGVAGTGAKTAFMFPGQGSQRVGMARGLGSAFPAFASAFDELCQGFDGAFEVPLRTVIFAEPESAEAGLLDQTAYTQAALFVMEVALCRLLESWGVVPDLVLGHSIGEVTAAYVAGVWSLADACALVAARGRLMQALPPGGAMVTVTAGVDQVAAALRGFEDRVGVAAVNGPESVVVSGAEAQVEQVVAALAAGGARSRRLRVSHAFHSPLMDPMLADFERVCAGLTYRPPRIGVVSNLTGELADADELCSPGYWVRHVREPVRFAEALGWAQSKGEVRCFLEVGPGAALTVSAQGGLAPGSAVVQGTSRARTDADIALLCGLAGVYAAGTHVDWASVFAGSQARRVDLPTYAFDRKYFWLDRSDGVNLSAAGLQASEHPLLGARLSLAEDGGLVLSGRLSVQSHPWLSDHRVGGKVLLPGTAFVELALHIGELVESPVLGELILQSPLVIPDSGAVEVQVIAGMLRESGDRAVSVHSRAPGAGDTAWVRHAAGVLRADDLAGTGAVPDLGDFVSWPPEGAVALELGDVYADLAGLGYQYGPVFQGLAAVWRRGDSIFAEVALPEPARGAAEKFGVHPALLDAALHAMIATAVAEGGWEAGEVRLPFAWEGVSLHAVGASSLRVRLHAAGPDSIALTLADAAGGPVAHVASLTTRAVSMAALGAASRSVVDEALFGVDWVPLPQPDRPTPMISWSVPKALHGNGSANGSMASLLRCVVGDREYVVLRRFAGTSDSAMPEHIRTEVTDALARTQELLAGPETIIVVTRGAVGIDNTEDPTDVAGAAVWGLLRSAQNENPGRIMLVDVDEPDAYRAAIATAIAAGPESQLAIRRGVPHAPRLARRRADAPERDGSAVFDPEGSVLVTGGTGGLGGLLARHLVAAHGVRHLILTSRRGRSADGAPELVAELSEAGASVDVVDCDVADRSAVDDLIAGIDPQHPLTAIVHTAGVVDDALFTAQTPESVAKVLGPKAVGAWHLHDATRELPLAAFVLYSSVAGLLGSPGQGNYAAANAVLDALAQHRRAQGLPATAMAWGLWERATGITGGLQATDRERMRRSGFVPISDADGRALFDAALGSGHALIAPARIDVGAIRRSGADSADLPPLLRGLLRSARRVADGGSADSAKLVTSLIGLTRVEQERVVLETVRAHAAAVLGHESSRAVPADAPFLELGFDSLGAVEFRNRLQSATGVKLPTTVVFDYPNPLEFARYICAEIAPVDDPAARLLEQVATLAAACSSVDLEPAELGALAARMDEILRGLRDQMHVSDAAAEDFGAADDDAIFEFIDQPDPLVDSGG
ncbi:SDR family NAD(P)-dependent oxidoreductase [Nocardia sp. NPDC057030]|uniref:SDR family NAD(P)-dependent oxidoreductase n=1 Tax=unclassified Nocardia TaxID=2637762 RepID=UPI0036332DE2